YQDPSSLDNLIALAERPNVYVKLSGYHNSTGEPYPYASARPLLNRMLGAYGRERVMWGTDWPVCLKAATYAEAFRSSWELPFLTDADRSWIFDRTARTAWRIPA
ncbi:MAG: amidohydrolase family protein, partial [Actinobacteria bacterium]|nr:amidohydrolase family protein [Actinomycetota bacterium]